MKKLINLLVLILTIFTINFMQPAHAIESINTANNGAKIFEYNCAGCHINGSNIIRRGKNLKIKALKKYGYDSTEAIAEIVTNGKNNMSAYKDRLSEEQIQEVAAYVLEQANNNWR